MNISIDKTMTNLNAITSDNEKKIISEEILQSKDPEKNYNAAIQLGVNKIRHLQVVIESKDPLLNYKCVKHCIKTNSLTTEEKKLLVAVHSQVVLHSNNKDIIHELNKFLKYYPSTKQKSRK